MKTDAACPVCGAAGRAPLFEKGGHAYLRCTGCGFIMSEARAAAGALAAAYDAAYTGTYIAKSAAKLARCRRAVRRIVRRYVRGGRWLDVGCSAGFLVRAAQDAGFDAFGIDVEPAGIAHAREHLGLTQVECGALDGARFAPASFDVITLYDVIEHVPDLNATVALLARLLRPGGVIEIRTPDAGHWRTPRRLQDWNEVKPGEHLYHFTRATLGRLLERHGLRIVARRLALKPGLKVYVRHANRASPPCP
ncbi:MAG: class I SAM-dependent methyltransferase [Gammaproteobacteria bacterium]